MQNNDTYRLYENDVDQLFGSKLENYRPPDPGNNWNDLQKRLDARDAQRKKPAYGKWLLALLLLTGITIGTIYVVSSSKKAPTNENQYALQEQAAAAGAENTKEQTPNNKPIANDKTGNSLTGNATPSTTQNNNTTGAGTNSPDKKIPAAAQNNNSNTSNNNTIKNNDVNNTVAANNNRNVITANRTTPPNIKPRPLVSTGNNTGRNIAAKNKGRRGVNGTLPELSAKNGGATFGEKETVVKNDKVVQQGTSEEEVTETAPANIELKEATVAEPANEPKKEAQAEPVEKNTGSIMNTTAANEAATANAAPVTKSKKRTRTRKEPPEHDYTNMQGKWYLEAFSGYNNSVKDNKSFAAFLAPAGYVEKRLNQENALVSMQAGVNVKYRRNHFIFGAGLSYLELGDMVKYDAGYSGPVALNANGRSKLTYVEVPLSAGYDWANKRWGFSLQGGLSAGILMGARGKYVSVNSFNSELFDLNSNKSIFRKTQLNLLVTPSVNYYLNENTNVFVSPLYRLNLQPVTVTGASINQKYYGMGLRVGIRTSLR